MLTKCFIQFRNQWSNLEEPIMQGVVMSSLAGLVFLFPSAGIQSIAWLAGCSGVIRITCPTNRSLLSSTVSCKHFGPVHVNTSVLVTLSFHVTSIICRRFCRGNTSITGDSPANCNSRHERRFAEKSTGGPSPPAFPFPFKVDPLNPARGLEERCKLPGRKLNLVYFSLKISHLVATILI